MQKIIAKKSLGQNFLKSPKILDKIIKTANLKKEDIVLEVGPGKGSLTEKLLEKSTNVIAIEKDGRLIEFLQKKFSEEIKDGKLELIHADILKIKTSYLFKNYKIKNYKIISNIPYYITGKLIRKFLSSDFQPSKMILMVQKEVANRIVRDKQTKKSKENILSLSIKVYGEPKYIKTVSAKHFSPQPKVDSAILLINNISKDFFEIINEKKFFNLIHQAFSSKRKTLVNNLTSIKSMEMLSPQLSKRKVVEILEKLNISPKIRAEDLSLNNWKNLYKKLKI